MSIYCPTTVAGYFTTFLFIDTFKVQAFTSTPDGSGGQSQTWADQTTGIKGMFEESQYRPLETVLGANQQAQRRWLILLERGTVVDESKLLIQTHKNGVAISPTRTFKIIGVRAEDTFATDVSCECEELPNLS